MESWLTDLSDDDMPNDDIKIMAGLYGVDFALKLMNDLPGAIINVPSNGIKKIRNRYICQHYDGSKMNRLGLAFECEVTEGYIKQLVSKNRRRHNFDMN